MLGMADATPLFDVLVNSGQEYFWDFPEEDPESKGDFLQAIQFPGGRVLVLPISFEPVTVARSQKELQAAFDEQKVSQSLPQCGGARATPTTR
eukprot:887851-Rhodomonas_salina.1